MAKIKTSESTTKREIIVAEASKLFWEKGYKAASMRDLAARVGVEAASLYNHITGKSDLLQEICERVGRRFSEKMHEVERERIPTIEKIEKLIRYHVREMIENYYELFVNDRDWRNLHEPQLSHYREMRRTYRKKFTAIVQLGIDFKEIKPVDANTTVMIFMNAINAVDQWHRIVHKVDSNALENNMVTVLTGGLKQNDD